MTRTTTAPDPPEILMHTPRLVADPLSEPSWRGAAQCRQKNAGYFFAPPHFERKLEKDTREGAARALCGACQVQEQCLDYALEAREPHGIWGGLNELQRKRLLRLRGDDVGSVRAGGARQ